jgi:hypothetical protein
MDLQSFGGRSVIFQMKTVTKSNVRYDKLARNFLAGIALAATVTWWT